MERSSVASREGHVNRSGANYWFTPLRLCGVGGSKVAVVTESTMSVPCIIVPVALEAGSSRVLPEGTRSTIGSSAVVPIVVDCGWFTRPLAWSPLALKRPIPRPLPGSGRPAPLPRTIQLIDLRLGMASEINSRGKELVLREAFVVVSLPRHYH
jgi:hypothetical protein